MHHIINIANDLEYFRKKMPLKISLVHELSSNHIDVIYLLSIDNHLSLSNNPFELLYDERLSRNKKCQY